MLPPAAGGAAGGTAGGTAPAAAAGAMGAAAPAAIVMSLEGVVAAVAAWIILNQFLNINNIIGCSLILAGVLYFESGRVGPVGSGIKSLRSA